MGKVRVFIDGREGTTGLRIADRLAKREDIELLSASEEARKDPRERARLVNSSDVTLLCLPDDGARETVSLCENPDTVVIDASTAHRTLEGWVYGFPELSRGAREAVKKAKRIAVPGCHASGFLALAAPLRTAGVLSADYPLVCHSVTGYSGGGKKMIAEYEKEGRKGSDQPRLASPRQYALALSHKHLPEMKQYAALDFNPVFNPIVADYYAGMVVSLPLHTRLLKGNPTAADLHELFSAHYAGEPLITVAPLGGEGLLDAGFLGANALAGRDGMELFVTGGAGLIQLCARFDNLGKGASGAAVQCLNLATGAPETAGLVL